MLRCSKVARIKAQHHISQCQIAHGRFNFLCTHAYLLKRTKMLKYLSDRPTDSLRAESRARRFLRQRTGSRRWKAVTRPYHSVSVTFRIPVKRGIVCACVFGGLSAVQDGMISASSRLCVCAMHQASEYAHACCKSTCW